MYPSKLQCLRPGVSDVYVRTGELGLVRLVGMPDM